MVNSNKGKLIAKLSAIVLALILIASLIVSIYFGVDQEKRNRKIAGLEDITIQTSAKNVILMIGDGMGANHIKAAKTYYGNMYMESLAVVDGQVTTFSLNDWTTDSAAAATALATGQKVNNRQISRHKLKNLKTISEYAMENNKEVGIIATEGLYGATPASFSAHSNSRIYTNKIIESQIASGITLMMGADKAKYDGYVDKIRANGYSYINNMSNTADLMQKPKLFGTFDEISTAEDSETLPTLATLSGFALDYLSQKSGDNGFFLMIEGSHIDKRSHANDMDGMLKQIKGFDLAVKTVVEWANTQNDTMVIVTADHETGDLRYDNQPREQITDALFHSGGHTSQNVRIFYYGVTVPKATFQNKVIDNTHVFSIIYQALFN